MKQPLHGRPRRLAVAVGAAALAATIAITVPAIASTTHQDHAKKPTLGGLARQVASLRTHDAALSRQIASLRHRGTVPGASGPVGPTGPRGAVGQTGPQGPIGPAGPTITTFNSFRTLAGVDIGPAGTPVTVMSLSSGTSGGGPIKLPFAGRIFVSGSVTVFSTNANGSRIFCWLVIGTDASAPEINTFSAVDLPATNGVSASLPVVGSVSEPAGTYDLSVVCNLNGPGAASFFLGNLVAWAVPT